ncbi:hypothetical protein Y032_0080g1320 [Ancylostoma ceylanicum]|uniref:Uncharacterized protein n=1 Tax=Ancylostoma ceylanicum TaxID=53326 RepID=A0A016TTH2_9BILA|nr:hypothetical protein Y032_0080g1320 [Ancylostoma ceylanicum]
MSYSGTKFIAHVKRILVILQQRSVMNNKIGLYIVFPSASYVCTKNKQGDNICISFLISIKTFLNLKKCKVTMKNVINGDIDDQLKEKRRLHNKMFLLQWASMAMTRLRSREARGATAPLTLESSPQWLIWVFLIVVHHV